MNSDIIILDNKSPLAYDMAASFISAMNNELERPVPSEWLDKIYNKAVIVASLNTANSISGWIVFYCNDKSNGVAYVAGCHVLKEYRGHGLSKRLLTTVIEICEKEGMNRLSLYCKCDNEIALNLYKSTGFRIINIQKKAEYQNEDHFYMELTFSNH